MSSCIEVNWRIDKDTNVVKSFMYIQLRNLKDLFLFLFFASRALLMLVFKFTSYISITCTQKNVNSEMQDLE